MVQVQLHGPRGYQLRLEGLTMNIQQELFWLAIYSALAFGFGLIPWVFDLLKH